MHGPAAMDGCVSPTTIPHFHSMTVGFHIRNRIAVHENYSYCFTRTYVRQEITLINDFRKVVLFWRGNISESLSLNQRMYLYIYIYI